MTAARNARLLVVMFALLLLLPAPASRAQESVPFETLLLGAWSAFPRTPSEESEVQIITSERKWRKVWNQAHPFVDPPPPLPEVDFSQHMVIVLYYRYLPDPSFTMMISDLVKQDDHLEIAVQEIARRGLGCLPVPAVTVSPFQIIETEILKKRYRNNIRITSQREIIDCASGTR